MKNINLKLFTFAAFTVLALIVFQNCGDSSDPVAVVPTVTTDPLDVVVVSDTTRDCVIDSSITAVNGQCLNETISCSLNPWPNQFSGTTIAVNTCSSLNNLITFNGLTHADTQTYIASYCASTSTIATCNDNSTDSGTTTPTSCTTATSVSLLCEYNGSNIAVSGHTTCPSSNHGSTCVNNFVLDYGSIDYAHSSITYECFNGTWINSLIQQNYCKLSSYSAPSATSQTTTNTSTCSVAEYCSKAPGLANCSTAAFSHYYTYGRYEGRCQPIFSISGGGFNSNGENTQVY